MSGEADPSRRVHVQADVSSVGQGWAAGVKADAHPNLDLVRPGAGERLALNGQRGIEGGARLGKDREHLVSRGVDLAAARSPEGSAKQAADVGPQPGIAIAKLSQETGR